MITEANESNFENLISNKVTIVQFTAEWCGPCRFINPILEKLNEDYEEKLNIIKVDVDEFPEIAQKHNVKNIPSLLFYDNGDFIEKVVGAKPTTVYQKIIDKILKKEDK